MKAESIGSGKGRGFWCIVKGCGHQATNLNNSWVYIARDHLHTTAQCCVYNHLYETDFVYCLLIPAFVIYHSQC